MRIVFRLRAFILVVFFCGIYGQATETGSASYVAKDGVYKHADLVNSITSRLENVTGKERVTELLQTLAAMGQPRQTESGLYMSG